MRYVSTRGHAPVLDFEGVVLAGLAEDGGLYLPEQWPQLSVETLRSLRGKPYVDVAVEVMAPFVEPCLDRVTLRALVEDAYRSFRHEEITPVVPLGEGLHLLELAHGPTLAFKDVALQLLGRFFDHFLSQRKERVTVVGATSGDTGSAAISGCRGLDAVDIFVLHPKGRTSDVQRRQMTTIVDDNVYNIALEGTFDDAQALVKTMFRDLTTRRELRLTAVNSINWARVMAQIVYYFTSALALGAPDRAISYSVPTGNFGDVLAGWCARQMGLPISRLVVATNTNDILARTLRTGEYATAGVTPTLSPSMDIQVSSNFERLLFESHNRDATKIRAMMADLSQEGRFVVEGDALEAIREVFGAHSLDDEGTIEVIRQVYEETGMLVDPHTAIGVSGGRAHAERGTPMVVLSTAHAAKFPDAVEQATGKRPPLPSHLSDLFERDEEYTVLPHDRAQVEAFIRAHTRVDVGG